MYLSVIKKVFKVFLFLRNNVKLERFLLISQKSYLANSSTENISNNSKNLEKTETQILKWKNILTDILRLWSLRFSYRIFLELPLLTYLDIIFDGIKGRVRSEVLVTTRCQSIEKFPFNSIMDGFRLLRNGSIFSGCLTYEKNFIPKRYFNLQNCWFGENIWRKCLKSKERSKDGMTNQQHKTWSF